MIKHPYEESYEQNDYLFWCSGRMHHTSLVEMSYETDKLNIGFYLLNRKCKYLKSENSNKKAKEEEREDQRHIIDMMSNYGY